MNDGSSHSSIRGSSARPGIKDPFNQRQWEGLISESSVRFNQGVDGTLLPSHHGDRQAGGAGELNSPLLGRKSDDSESVYSEDGVRLPLRANVSNSYDFSMSLCPIATAVFKEVYTGVEPQEHLQALLDAAGYDDIEDEGEGVPETVSFYVMEDDSSERAVRFGAKQCSEIGKFLETYGKSSDTVPRPRSEMPRRTLYIGIPCFEEPPDEIIPTVDSILRNGGDDSCRVHVVLCGDVSKDKVTGERIDQTPFGVTWTREDKKFSMTFLNKGLKAFTGKSSSLYMISKYVRARMHSAVKDEDEEFSGVPQLLARKNLPPLKTYLIMADTRIIYGQDSVTLMMEYMSSHDDVIACTGTQELYPIKWNSTTVEGTETRALQKKRPSYWEWLGAPAMQQFEFEANYAQGQYAYHMGGHLAILPGPCHFLDMNKVDQSGVFEAFNRDILKYGSKLTTSHMMKLYVMAEDRHLSTLYTSITNYKTAWVQGAHFYYKPEMTWVNVLLQRLRWQGGTLAQMYVIVFRPAIVGLGKQHWVWWYTLLSAFALIQFVLCCFGNTVWVLITHFGRFYSPITSIYYRDLVFDAVIWANLIFPWFWVGWGSAINHEWISYDNDRRSRFITSVMMAMSLTLSAVSVVINAMSLANPVCDVIVDDDFFPFNPTPAPTLAPSLPLGNDNAGPCNIWNWMKVLAVGIALMPIIAWALTGPSAGYKSITALLRTCVLSFFTPLLFSMHQYNSTPLHVATRIQDLKWRGNKVMQSEITKHSSWTQYVGWLIVLIHTAFVLLSQASPLAFTKTVYVSAISFVIFLLAPQVVPLVVGFWLCIEYFIRECRSPPMRP